MNLKVRRLILMEMVVIATISGIGIGSIASDAGSSNLVAGWLGFSMFVWVLVESYYARQIGN